MLGPYKDKVDSLVSKYLKPMPAAGYMVLILLTINIIYFAYQLWNEKDQLENDKQELEKDVKELKLRAEKLQDERILRKPPLITISSRTEEDKLLYLQKMMQNFVNHHSYVDGLQLYEYSRGGRSGISINRVIEYVDNISSWQNAFLKVNITLHREFQEALKLGKEKEFIEKYCHVLNYTEPDNLTEEHVYQYALVNVANQCLVNKGESFRFRLNYLVENKLFELNKRIGIFEALIYFELTEKPSGYIFQKRHGDRSKQGRYYLTLEYSVNEKIYLMLFTFNKDITQGKRQVPNIETLLRIAEEFFETLAK